MTSCIFQKKRAFASVWLEVELGGPLLRPNCTEQAYKCLCFRLILGGYALKQADCVSEMQIP